MADVAKIQEAVTAYVGFFNEEGKILALKDGPMADPDKSSLDNSYFYRDV